MLVSVQVVGPGDTLLPMPVADPEAEDAPPLLPKEVKLQLRHLVVTVWRTDGLHLPGAAEAASQGLAQYVRLSVGGYADLVARSLD